MSVTLSELKSHLRISDANEDTALQIYLDAALDYIDGLTGRIMTQVTNHILYFDGFGELELIGDNPATVVVKYIDTDGAEQTLSSAVYAVKTHKARSYITLAYDQSWPDTRAQDAAVWVDYTTGYTAGTIPKALKHAVLLEAACGYEHREAESIVKTHNRKAVERLAHKYIIFKT